ncbi:down syndrome cell adhesion molecule-like protein Dscam2 [Caerostris darwini]|uniref:Down syndrome cell adhesion molecule-like protein Dscam2 n=1 Tax=Caerostris darwini TaxID=1538125 RepID=A0AAV4UVX8_9ARAC|nr:down syndrome cell adhesion molecule-like protein Dscam2 [Caerostris darwini]
MEKKDPPEFREVFSDRLLRPGAKTSLRCLVTGNPLPQVSWRLYSRPVVEGLGVRIGDFVDSQGLLMSFINISAVTSEHGGIYSCHARNEIGAISHSARLSVYGPPYIHPMDNITVVTGDEVNVDCAVSGHPLRSIRWKKGEELFVEVESSFLTIGGHILKICVLLSTTSVEICRPSIHE